MDGKELVKQLFSRKFAVALVGIFALCYIASISGGQVTVEEKSVVSIVPMPKIPGPEQQIEWLKLAAMIGVTLISCLTVIIQGRLDRLKMSGNKLIFDKYGLSHISPENIPPMPSKTGQGEPADPQINSSLN